MTCKVCKIYKVRFIKKGMHYLSILYMSLYMHKYIYMHICKNYLHLPYEETKIQRAMCTGWYRQQMVKSDIKYKEKWIQNYMCAFYFLDSTRRIFFFFFIQHHLLLLLLITHILLFSVLEVFRNIVFFNLPSSIVGLREGIAHRVLWG